MALHNQARSSACQLPPTHCRVVLVDFIHSFFHLKPILLGVYVCRQVGSKRDGCQLCRSKTEIAQISVGLKLWIPVEMILLYLRWLIVFVTWLICICIFNKAHLKPKIKKIYYISCKIQNDLEINLLLLVVGSILTRENKLNSFPTLIKRRKCKTYNLSVTNDRERSLV